VTVRPLSLADAGVVAGLVALQRAAYRVEADLIGADAIPVLTETEAELAASGESFLGAGEGDLLAALSYVRTAGVVDIHRLVVHPDAFRRGLATSLLDALERAEPDATEWRVSTAAANAPALALYAGRGFERVQELEAPGGVPIVHEVRRLR
jgi:ribosomal protein S18 acetylase RimI-like enzyme